jgi:hypothetical protein
LKIKKIKVIFYLKENGRNAGQLAIIKEPDVIMIGR